MASLQLISPFAFMSPWVHSFLMTIYDQVCQPKGLQPQYKLKAILTTLRRLKYFTSTSILLNVNAWVTAAVPEQRTEPNTMSFLDTKSHLLYLQGKTKEMEM